MSLAHALPEYSDSIEPTDENVKDPDLSGLTVLGDHIVVRPWSPPTTYKSKSGVTLLLPNSIKKDAAYLQNTGKVLKVGNTAWKDPNVKPEDGKRFPHGFYEGPWAKPGDFIVHPRHTGQRFKYKGVNLMLIKDSHVLFVVDDPADIDLLASVLETNDV